MSKVKALYHIVFCTRKRKMTIPLEHSEDLYRFIWKDLTEAKCRLLRIGGIQNHVHMLIELHPTVALSTLMQTIKSHSSGWMRSDSRFPDFEGWASDYYAFTIAEGAKTNVIEYIRSQREHHLGNDLDEEFYRMYRYAGLTYDERDMQ